MFCLISVREQLRGWLRCQMRAVVVCLYMVTILAFLSYKIF